MVLEDIRKNRAAMIAIPSIMGLAAFVLWTQGRVWWCQAGDYWPWAWNIWSTHNSQHLIDPYSFTHILHGVLEFWLLGLIFRKMPVAWRLVIAVAIEACWEMAENSAYVIERYRAATISLDYFGDSIINSMSDIFCCGLGFVIAYKLKLWRSLALFVATELVLLVTIRDSLVVNIIMLALPQGPTKQAILQWQMAGK